MSAVDGLDLLSSDNRLGLGQRMSSGVRMDIKLNKGLFSLVFRFLGFLQGDLDLSISVGDFRFEGKSNMHGSINSSTVELLSDGREDSSTDVPLVVRNNLHDQLKLGLGGGLPLRLDFSVSIGDSGSSGLHEDGHTRFSGEGISRTHEINNLEVFKVHSSGKFSLVSGNVGGDLSDNFTDILLIKGVQLLQTKELHGDMSLRLFIVHIFDVQLSHLVLNLSPVAGNFRLGSLALVLQGRVHLIELVNDILSTLDVESGLKGINITGKALHGSLGMNGSGVDRFFSRGVLELMAYSSSDGLNELGNLEIARVLDSLNAGLGQRKGDLSLHLDGIILGKRSSKLAQGLEGRVDVGRHLPGGFKPSSDCQSLEVSSGRVAVGKSSDSSHSDLNIFSRVLNQRLEDGPVNTGVLSGGSDELVDSNRSGVRAGGDSSFNNLQKFLGGFFSSNVSKSIDISDNRSHINLGGFLKLSGQVGDEVVLDDRHAFMAELSIESIGEFLLHAFLVDASLVDKLSKSHGIGSSDNSVSLDVLSLEQLNKLTEELLSGSLDRSQGIGKDPRPGSRFSDHISRLNLVLDELHAGVGGSHGDKVKEGLLNSGFVLHAMLTFNGSFNFLEGFIAELAHDSGSQNRQTSNILLLSRAFRHLFRFLNNFSEDFNNHLLEFSLRFSSGDNMLGSRGHVRDGGMRFKLSSLPLLLLLLLLDLLLLERSAAGGAAGRIFIDKGSVFLGRGGSGDFLLPFLNSFKLQGGDRRNFQLLVALESSSSAGDDSVLGDNLPDDMIIKRSTDDGLGQRGLGRKR